MSHRHTPKKSLMIRLPNPSHQELRIPQPQGTVWMEGKVRSLSLKFLSSSEYSLRLKSRRTTAGRDYQRLVCQDWLKAGAL